jgi:unsaturated rhamnogalacturonyl hydrolase
MNSCKTILFASALVAAAAAAFLAPGFAVAQTATAPVFPGPGSPTIAMATTAMDLWKDTADAKSAKWTYDEGVVCLGLEGLWLNTGDARYFKYIQRRMDRLVEKDGTINTYKLEDYNLDNVLCGRVLLMLYKVTNQEKYYKAAQTLRQQLKDQPRTHGGSFWHKKKYTEQVWLDGLYMAQPFFAEYSSLFHEDANFDDIARQFAAIEQHTRDPKTGLLYHGWDESGAEKWVAKDGHSPNFWARAMGWYGMALVDALDYFPAHHPGRATLSAILQRYAIAIQKAQDPATGLWWDILDRPGAKGNYLEASASSMFVYTLAKAARKGYLPATAATTASASAKKGYSGILGKFITKDAAGASSLQGTVSVSGLGGSPYRDGSYEYYIGEKVVPNDPKGVGAFLLAADEMDMMATQAVGKGRTVLLDYYFNNEHHKDVTGASVRFHYVWDDWANSGFSIWGHLFRQYGMHTDTLPTAPTAANLANASVYIVVDPDDEKESPAPNYPDAKDIASLYDWVKGGGVLVLMSNDSANCEFTHFNTLAGKFGIHFNWDCYHKVTGNKFEMGAFSMTVQDAGTDGTRSVHEVYRHSIFPTTGKIYIKELSTLKLNDPAKPYYTDGGNVIMATAKIGKGTVFAVGDPWLYNEYTDGRKLPSDFDNFNAARDLAQWLIRQANR